MRFQEESQNLAQGNGQFTEWISAYHRGVRGKARPRPRGELLRSAAETLAAMANADGGAVYLGADSVEDLRGVPWAERERRNFVDALREAFDPPLSMEAVEEEFLGKRILRFSVLPSPAVHAPKGGRVRLRVGPLNLPLSRGGLEAWRERRRETWHEREILPRSSLKDLDPALVEDFLSRAGLEGDPERLFHRPYGLIEYREGSAFLTRAAAYLFGRDPLRWHPRPGIEFVRIDGREERSGEEYNLAERIRIEEPVLRLIGRSEAMIGERVKAHVLQRDLFFRERFEYPSFSWKEALVNAVAHRDYSLMGAPISVWMFEDRIEIRNPGGFPLPFRGAAVKRGPRLSYSRNPLMARVLADAGYMKAMGEGIPRILEEFERQGLNPPEWKEEGGFCCLVFRRAPVLDESTRAWLQQFSRSPLNERQKRILAYARLHGGTFSSADYQKFGVDRDAAYAEIRTLVRQGLAEPLKKHGKVYRLRQAKEEEVPFAGLDWILRPLREKGHFALKELEIPPFFSPKKVRALVRRLVAEGYLSALEGGKTGRFAATEKIRSLPQKTESPLSTASAPSPGEKKEEG